MSSFSTLPTTPHAAVGVGVFPEAEADVATTMAATMLIYVDNIIITGSCKQVVSTLMQKLRDSFAVKDLEKLSFLLSVDR
jgi:hypothetical protein